MLEVLRSCSSKRFGFKSVLVLSAVFIMSTVMLSAKYGSRSRLQSTACTTPGVGASPAMMFDTQKLGSATSVPTGANVELYIDDVVALLRQITSREPGQLTADVISRVSMTLNSALKRFHKQRCVSPGVDFTDTGAWCQRAVDSLHITDGRLADALADMLAGSTVLSLGEGTGFYRERILNSSKVKEFDAFDGAPYSEETTSGNVRFLDLTVPQLWLPHYDWVICLEVIEHVPAEFESLVLDNIMRPARVGIVVSWALPTQPGARHINPRSAEYVEGVLAARGLVLDVDWTTKLRASAELPWFRNNTLVYRVSQTA